MVAGTLSMLSCLSLAVLIQTGWFSGLEKSLKLKKEWLVLGLLLESLLLWVELPPEGNVRMHAGMILFIPFLYYLYQRVEEERIPLFLSVLFTGSFTFFLQELYRFESAMAWSGLRSLGLLVITGLAFVSSSCLAGKLVVAMGGLCFSEGLHVLLHQNEMNPVFFGDPSFLDLLWMTFVVILVSHSALPHVRMWIRTIWRMVKI